MKNISLRRRTLLRVGLTFLAVGGLHHDARSQDTASPQSPKPASDVKLILEANWWVHDYMSGMDRALHSGPQLMLRVFSDKTAELPGDHKATKRTTLTQEQFDKVRAFLDQPDLLGQKDRFCGYGGADYEHVVIITLHRGEQQQLVTLTNFDPSYVGTVGRSWPGQCPKIIVKLQCTVEGMLGELDGKTTHWKEDCEDILAK
jgi:hypothetical protein